MIPEPDKPNESKRPSRPAGPSSTPAQAGGKRGKREETAGKNGEPLDRKRIMVESKLRRGRGWVRTTTFKKGAIPVKAGANVSAKITKKTKEKREEPEELPRGFDAEIRERTAIIEESSNPEDLEREKRHLEELIGSAEVVNERRIERHGEPENPGRHIIRVLSAEEIISRPPQQWKIERLIPRESLVLLYGETQSGKSFIALHMALCVAHGRSFGELRSEPGGVAYLFGEGAGGFGKRIHAASQHGGFPLPWERLRFIEDTPNFGSREETASTAEGITEHCPWGVELIFVDTFANHAIGLEENSARDTGIFLDNLAWLGKQFRATVVIVHHTGKGGGPERGSATLKQRPDTKIKITQHPGNIHHLAVEKQRDLELLPAMAFERRIVSLDGVLGGFGLRETSCVMDPLGFTKAIVNTTPVQLEILGYLSQSSQGVHKTLSEIARGVGKGESHVANELKRLRENELVAGGDRKGWLNTEAGNHRVHRVHNEFTKG